MKRYPTSYGSAALFASIIVSCSTTPAPAANLTLEWGVGFNLLDNGLADLDPRIGFIEVNALNLGAGSITARITEVETPTRHILLINNGQLTGTSLIRVSGTYNFGFGDGRSRAALSGTLTQIPGIPPVVLEGGERVGKSNFGSSFDNNSAIVNFSNANLVGPVDFDLLNERFGNFTGNGIHTAILQWDLPAGEVIYLPSSAIGTLETPEPGSMAILTIGLLGLLGWRWKEQR